MEIQTLRADHLPGVLDLLDEVMGPGHHQTWYRWKHESSPFGPSLGWVATDGEGIVGIRLFMRWQLTLGESIVDSLRPVDTVTAPRARRQGVFSALTRASLEAISDVAPGVSLIFNTPNANSREGYRKMDWTLLDPIPHVLSVTGMPVRGIQMSADVDTAFDKPPRTMDRLRTHRSSAYIAWRYSTSSGRDYGFAALRGADNPTAIVYRVSRRRRMRILVVCETVGTGHTLRRLIAGVCRETGCRLTLSSQSTSERWRSMLRFGRGSSVLAVRPLEQLPVDPLRSEAWNLEMGDLEDVL